MKRLVFSILVAFVLWAMMFWPKSHIAISFWLLLTESAILLVAMTTIFQHGWWRNIRLRGFDVLFGVFLALFLWYMFWMGDIISEALFSYAREEISEIYRLKDGESPWVLASLLLLIIGPAEEIFWRGYVQRTITHLWNPNAAFVITTLSYALVHVCSGNLILVMSALVAGFVWGSVFRFWPHRLGAIILSHALWDVLVFVLFTI